MMDAPNDLVFSPIEKRRYKDVLDNHLKRVQRLIAMHGGATNAEAEKIINRTRAEAIGCYERTHRIK